MMPRAPRLSLRPVLRMVALLAPLLGAVFLFGWALNLGPDQVVRIARGPLLIYALLLLLLSLPAAILATRRSRRTFQPVRIEVLAAGLEHDDTYLLTTLFPNSDEARLIPLGGGYSGAAVFEAQSWNAGALQRPSVVKIGTSAKLQPELDNYERYVKEYVGNTATLLGVSQRGSRMALRWAYAGFSGDARTLADYAATGQPIVPIIDELFSSRSTLGLLLGSPRRDPGRMLYREYSWNAKDWGRILAEVRTLVGEVPPSLLMIARWHDPTSGEGTRSQRSFDAPVAIAHGDLNSRNILLDGRGTIFVIDFAHTAPGHLLRDFARLEAELLLVVDQPHDEATLAARVAQADLLLRPPSRDHAITLRELLRERPGDGLPAAVLALRRRAHDLAGPWLNEPVEQYLIALLHATLDTVRYAQCGPFAKRAALHIAERIVALLNDAR